MERFNFISISLGDECEICQQNTRETVESCELCLQETEPCEERTHESLHDNVKAHRACFLKDHQIHEQSQHNSPVAKTHALGEKDSLVPSPPSNYVKMRDKIQAKLSSIPKFIVNPLYRYTHSSASVVDSAELLTSSCDNESTRDKLPETRLTVSQPSYSLDGATVRYYTLSPFERRRQFAQTRVSPMRRSRSEGRINECRDESSHGCLHCVQQPAAAAAAVADTGRDTEAGEAVMTGSLQNTVQANTETQGRGTARGMGSPRSVGSDGVDSPTPQRIPDCECDQDSNIPTVTQDTAGTPTQCLEADDKTKTNPRQDTKAKHNLPIDVSAERSSQQDAEIFREASSTPTKASDDMSQKCELLQAKNQQISNDDHNADNDDNDDTSVQKEPQHQQQHHQQQKQPRTRHTLSPSREMPVIVTSSKGPVTACTCASESCNKCSENSEKKNSKNASDRLNTALRQSSCPSPAPSLSPSSLSPTRSKPCTGPSEGAVLSLTEAMEYTKEKLSYRCTEDLSVLLEHFSRQIQAVSEDLVQLLQDRHELQEQVEMRKIAIDQLLRLQTNTPGVNDLDIYQSIALPAGVQTNR